MKRRLPSEDRAGLYITVIVHLTVIIILLGAQLGISVSNENSFVLDFTKQEQLEKLQKELALKEEISKRLQDMIGDVSSGTDIHNVSVNRAALKDDRNTDAEQLYKDAEKLQKELNSAHSAVEEDVPDISPAKTDKGPNESEKAYSGPSVLSWQLDGRRARHLPIPSYRCMGAGEVTVLITVDNKGNVINASIAEGVSSSEQCLRNFAVRAARMSKFSASETAPARQLGNIVYSFIAQ